MHQLSANDAVFLSVETPETPSVIGGLAILDLGTAKNFDFDAFAQFVAERLAVCPRFSWKLQEVPLGLDLPYWVEEGPFDVYEHVHRAALPTPGADRELSDLASQLFTQPLDRSRPLWDMTLIEGLQGGRMALLWKIHHCLLDGVSGAGLLEMLFDVEPTPATRPLVEVDERSQAGPRRGLLEMALRSTRNAFGRPVALAGHVAAAGAAAIATLREQGAEGMASAPAASFNGVVGSKRSIAWSRVSLDEVLRLKNAMGVTVNDVVLALSAASVRNYLEQRDELPEESLFAIVPVSTRKPGDTSMGNQISEMPISWGTHVEHPVERLLHINEHTMRAKEQATENPQPPLLTAMSESLAPGALGLLMRVSAAFADRVPLPANCVVSNVRTTDVPLYIAGARIASMVPMSMLAPTQGLNITVVSYGGDLNFGVIADPELVSETWMLAEGIPKALLELQAAVDGWQEPIATV
jgi:WS/DGAT/MGAT family acyltransferase